MRRQAAILERYTRCIRTYSSLISRERSKTLKQNLNSANKSKIMLKEK
jgi:hypothetical protein